MWISKDMEGFVQIWEYKPTLDQNGYFYGDGDVFYLGKKRKLGIDLKRGKCKRVDIQFTEVK